MIGLLTGTVRNLESNPIIVVVGGVGYRVSIPNSLRTRTTGAKEQTFFIHTHVSDDAISLYGFTSEDDLMLFELLLTVGGIGPRTALSIVDQGSEKVRQAISQSDVNFFTMIPRLGKKNAQKIIIELRSKLGSITELDLTDDEGETKQIREALMAMGFGPKEILEALKTADGATMEEKIRQALKFLGKP